MSELPGLPPLSAPSATNAIAQQASQEQRDEARRVVHERLETTRGMTRQQFELQAVLEYIKHQAAFAQPQTHIKDVLLTAQMLADEMQLRGFFPNTREYREVPMRQQREKQNGGGLQISRSGDDPQGGDHKVLVTYDDQRR